MSNPKEKPTLSGTRIKTRKRDEKLKEKRDPTGFRDAILQGISETEDLEQLSKFLDTAKVDYRRYGETLFDILFAGGILAPGGSIVCDGDPDKLQKTDKCIFGAKNDLDSIKAYYDVLYKLIRRYKYLEKAFSEELKKLIMFLKGFDEEQRQKLGKIIGLCLANGLGNPACLSATFDDHLVKEGIALAFATEVMQVIINDKDLRCLAAILRKAHFEDNLLVQKNRLSLEFITVVMSTWLGERDLSNLASALKKGGLEGKLPNLLPINKRTQENFENHFRAAGLDQIVEYQRVKANAEVKRDLQRKLQEMINEEASLRDIITMVTEEKEKIKVADQDLVVMTWNTMMNTVEWNKKDELVADQALRHLKQYAGLLGTLTTTTRAELNLLLKIQEYCYDNMNFLKVFQKIVVLFYKMDVISEDVILHWYKEAHSPKGKSVFIDQMKSFIDWLNDAEEEESEDDED